MSVNDLEDSIKTMGAATVRLTVSGGATALFTAAGARLLGLWPDPTGPNVLWTNPQPPKHGRGGAHWYDWDSGGVGGDRLWFGPEHRWFFTGPPRADLQNWQLRAAIDPGNYTMHARDNEVRFEQTLTLDDVQAQVVRSFQVEPQADPTPELPSITLRELRSLRLPDPPPRAQLDVWNITQVPIGTWLIVPTRQRARIGVSTEAVPGELMNRVQVADDHIRWRVSGQGNVKGSLSVSAVRGITAALTHLGNGRFSLLVRRFLPSPRGRYQDGLFAELVDAQCVQWWDGYGFGEIESHSPTLSPDDPSLSEQHYVQAWVGAAAAIRRVATRWLECDLPDYMFHAD